MQEAGRGKCRRVTKAKSQIGSCTNTRINVASCMHDLMLLAPHPRVVLSQLFEHKGLKCSR